MRCPICRAENGEGPSCRRCRADLALLWQVEGQRQRTKALAQRYASMGRAAEARDAAERMHQCRPDVDSWQLLALTHLMQRDFAQAWRCYQAAMAMIDKEVGRLDRQRT